VTVVLRDANGGNVANVPFHLALECGKRRSFAAIRADGTPALASHVVSAQRLSTTANQGRYEVIFDRIVTGCTYTATIRLPDATAPTLATIATATRSLDPHGMFVTLHRFTGGTVDLPFHLVVTCP
jgi:hypothetical protein